jgi:hypothetical protein
MASRKVLELVVYKLKEGVLREQFLDTNEPASAWMERQPGFISRDLAYDADGDRWVDVVWWETMEQARTAAERAMTSDSCSPMFALIDMESALMLHGEQVGEAIVAATTVGE